MSAKTNMSAKTRSSAVSGKPSAEELLEAAQREHQLSTRRRRSGPPRERDLKIFKMVAIEQRSHGETARLMKTSRSRVSQIVKQIRQMLAQAAPDDPEIKE